MRSQVFRGNGPIPSFMSRTRVPGAWDAVLLSRWQCHGHASGGDKMEIKPHTPHVDSFGKSLPALPEKVLGWEVTQGTGGTTQARASCVQQVVDKLVICDPISGT